MAAERAQRPVVGCIKCRRFTRIDPAIPGGRYPYHKPGCEDADEWLSALRPNELLRLLEARGLTLDDLETTNR